MYTVSITEYCGTIKITGVGIYVSIQKSLGKHTVNKSKLLNTERAMPFI